MRIKNLFKVAWKSLLKNRMRSFLTMLGIIIGVGAVIVMVSIGEGSQERIKTSISSLGSNLLMIRSGTGMFQGVHRGAGSIQTLTLKDTETLKREMQYAKAVSPIVRSGGQVIGGGKNWSTTMYGVSPDYQIIKDWQMESGAFFTDREVRSRAKVIILGKTVANELFPDVDPTGLQIRFRNTPFKIIGVLKSKGQNTMGMDQDDILLSPVTTVFYRLTEGKFIQEIQVSAKTEDLMAEAQTEATALLRREHKIEPGMDDDFNIRNQTEIVEAFSSVTRTLTMLLGSIAAVSLIVGGIGIMNIMLVSVTERTREIGIRLAIGARESDVLIQFLVEAVVLSLMGGLIGIILAIAIAYGLEAYFSIQTLIDNAVTGIAFLFSGAVGIFFGYYPAKKAAALNPIEALRYE